MAFNIIAAASFIFLILSFYYLINIFIYKKYLKKIDCYFNENRQCDGKNNSNFKLNKQFVLRVNYFIEIAGNKTKRFLPSFYLKKIINMSEELFYFNNIETKAELIIGYKTVLPILFMIAGVSFFKNELFSFSLGFGGLIFGFILPDIFVKAIIKKGISRLEKELPFIADLLFITTLSGQNIYNSLKTINEKFNCSINRQIKCFLNNINMGFGKNEAYKDISEKNSSEVFKSFIITLKMAENYGSSISEIIKRKASFLRFNVYQEFERRTRLLSIKILFPLIFLILPAFILLVCGPIVYLTAENLFMK